MTTKNSCVAGETPVVERMMTLAGLGAFDRPWAARAPYRVTVQQCRFCSEENYQNILILFAGRKPSAPINVMKGERRRYPWARRFWWLVIGTTLAVIAVDRLAPLYIFWLLRCAFSN